MSKSALIGIIVAVLLVGGGALALTMGGEDTDDTNTATTQPTTPTPTPNNTARSPSPNADTTTDSTAQDETVTTATITYSSNGFSPATITVSSGDTIQVKNTSDDDLQFYSDPHPEHTTNEELNVGAISPGQTKSFTITQKGTFGFHNHLDDSKSGSITVQ